MSFIFRKEAESLVSQAVETGSVNEPLPYGRLLLNEVCRSGFADLAEALIKAGSDINGKDEVGGKTPLLCAYEAHRRDVVELLINMGADLSVTSPDTFALIHKVCLDGDLDLLRFLVRRGADVNTLSSNGETPLHCASRRGHPRIVAFLLDEGADVNAKNSLAQNALHLATEEKHREASTEEKYRETSLILLSGGIDMSCPDLLGSTPFHNLCSAGWADLVLSAVRLGVDVNLSDGYGWRPLHMAAYGGKEDVVDLLIAQGAEVDMTDSNGMTPLHKSCLNEERRTIKILVDSGADIHRTDLQGRSPLDILEKDGKADLAREVLSWSRECQSRTSLNNVKGLGFDPELFCPDRKKEVNAQDP